MFTVFIVRRSVVRSAPVICTHALLILFPSFTIHDVRNSVGFVIYLHTTSCSWLYLGFNHMPTVQPARQDSNNERYKSCDQRSVVILLVASSDKGNKHSSKPVVCLTFSCCCSGVCDVVLHKSLVFVHRNEVEI